MAHEPVPAALLLAALGITDWLDGEIARHFDLQTDLGELLDPMADRALLIGASAAILINRTLAPAPIMIAMLVRELVMAAGAAFLVTSRRGGINVHWTGKAGAFFMMWALPLFLLASDDQYELAAMFSRVAWGLALFGLLFAYVSFWFYRQQIVQGFIRP